MAGRAAATLGSLNSSPAKGSRTLPPTREEVTDDDVTRENDSDGRAGPLASARRLLRSMENLDPLYVEPSTVISHLARPRRDMETRRDETSTPRRDQRDTKSRNGSRGLDSGLTGCLGWTVGRFGRPVIAGPGGCYGSRGVEAAQWLEQFRSGWFSNLA